MQLSSLIGRLPQWGRKRNSADVFWELAKVHIRFLYSAAYRYSGNTYDAEDLVQEALTIGLDKFHQLRDIEAFKGWIFRILRSVYLKSRRRKAPVQMDNFESGIDYLAEIEQTDVQQSVADVYEQKVEAQAIQALLDKLPEKYKTVLILYYMQEQSYQEISDILDVPMGTVMSRISRAKQAMKRALLRDRLSSPEQRKVVQINTVR